MKMIDEMTDENTFFYLRLKYQWNIWYKNQHWRMNCSEIMMDKIEILLEEVE